MYADVVAAEKLSVHFQTQLVRDLERRRIIAARTRTATRPPTVVTGAHRISTLIPRLSIRHVVRPA